VDDYQPDGSGLPHLPITSTETENIPPTPNALDFCSTLHGSLYKFVHILITLLLFMYKNIYLVSLNFFLGVGDAPVGSEATSTHKTMSSRAA
jgi:hypothetical protein